MPEQKKGGFHALEQRIHELEVEDAKQEQAAAEHERRARTPREEPPDEAGRGSSSR
jgi:hypothetical protein